MNHRIGLINWVNDTQESNNFANKWAEKKSILLIVWRQPDNTVQEVIYIIYPIGIPRQGIDSFQLNIDTSPDY